MQARGKMRLPSDHGG